ncbi:hypothetical protein DH2020_026462 [Rehmannia glutinosa]|uniref:GRF-type domain-containing protein n=1 Tax=Rehmannia glutinosa TaxID=99300 RepID=A0ABR0VZN7_REHGL
MRTSWESDNPGRRFMGCGEWKSGGCNFFDWNDPPMCPRAMTIIPTLKRKIVVLEDEIQKQMMAKKQLKMVLMVSWCVFLAHLSTFSSMRIEVISCMLTYFCPSLIIVLELVLGFVIHLSIPGKNCPPTNGAGTEEKPSGQSRRERRKEARLAKNKKKFDSWVNHHQSKKDLKSEYSNKAVQDNAIIRNGDGGRVPSTEEDLRFEKRLAKKLKLKNGKLGAAKDDLGVLLEGLPSALDNLGEIEKVRNGAFSKNTKNSDSISEDLEDEISVDEGEEGSDSLDSSEEKKTKFEEYLENDIQGGKSLAEADLALERKLAKKLKIKAGKVKGDDDDMNMLLEGIPSVFDSSENKREQKPETRIRSKTETSGPLGASSELATGKYVAPHLRSRGGNESAEHAQLRKRIRGLLNRLSETNVESIAGEISTLYHSVGRSVGSQIVSEEVVASCSGGPRGNEHATLLAGYDKQTALRCNFSSMLNANCYCITSVTTFTAAGIVLPPPGLPLPLYAAVFAAFVAGMACLVGVDLIAKLLARLAKCFEEEYLKEDNLSLRNLTLLFSYLYVFGLCSSELIYDFLIMLGKRLTEVDVSTVLTVLQCCGMKLRGDDPVGMKNFISSVQSRVNELKAPSGDGESHLNNKRMEFMLETICDIKNNKKKSKEDTVQHSRIKKWLQKLRVDDILIRGLKWSKLLDPSKKGQWWLSGDIASATENIEEVAGTIDKEIPETKMMLQLAASQRMNTDARRAIFAIERSCGYLWTAAYRRKYLTSITVYLHLNYAAMTKTTSSRCRLEEKVAIKNVGPPSIMQTADDIKEFVNNYCLWDHFKELESMSLLRSMHLSKFTAEMIGSFSLSLAVLKAVELNDVVHLSPKKIMHFRMLFEAIFEFPDKLVWNIFTRIAVTPEYEYLRSGIEFFISKYVASSQKSLANKLKIARKALNNVEGIVM